MDLFLSQSQVYQNLIRNDLQFAESFNPQEEFLTRNQNHYQTFLYFNYQSQEIPNSVTEYIEFLHQYQYPPDQQLLILIRGLRDVPITNFQLHSRGNPIRENQIEELEDIVHWRNLVQPPEVKFPISGFILYRLHQILTLKIYVSRDFPILLKLGQHRCFYLIKVLIEYGADINFENQLCLSVVAQKGDLKGIETLISLGADFQKCRNRILKIAAIRGDLPILDFCLQEGANPQIGINEAIKKNQTEVIRRLSEFKIIISRKNLYHIITNQNLEMMKILVNSGNYIPDDYGVSTAITFDVPILDFLTNYIIDPRFLEKSIFTDILDRVELLLSKGYIITREVIIYTVRMDRLKILTYLLDREPQYRTLAQETSIQYRIDGITNYFMNL